MNCRDFPEYRGELEYVCLGCGRSFPADDLYYTCPDCASVLLLEDKNFNELKKTPGAQWRKIFDERQTSRCAALKGIFRFYELIAPVMDKEDIVWLGEGNTPEVDASEAFRRELGINFAFKNDGQNPSASFKDRGMACAFSFLKYLCRIKNWDEVLTICASTGDTSAAAALYAAYVGKPLKSVVLLPKGKVTPQQLSQPLGSGAIVLELPGVFDDCMKVVEYLAEHYRVALLNSKNSWRILGQESYAYEIAQWRGWDLRKTSLFVPIGNAGNITAIMSGCLKMRELGIIDVLPRIFGVQSEHANPVYKYYHTEPDKRTWHPVQVKPSVAQAAMIGNPVSFPRVRKLVEKYTDIAGTDSFNVIEVSEQEIMDAMLAANRHGHIACTQGGECLAGMKIAIGRSLLQSDEYVILDSTAHALKFADFQNKYFKDSLREGYGIIPDSQLVNKPVDLLQGKERGSQPMAEFAEMAGNAVARHLKLKPIAG